MKLRDICVDIFNFVEDNGSEVSCYLYHITEVPDLYLVQGETLNELAWVHIVGIAEAMQFWETLKVGGNILNRIRGEDE
jgi:hypothetical protein